MPLSSDDRAVVRSSLAVALPTAAYGISFGALATLGAGLDVWQTVFLSMVMFTGGSQFALIGVLASGGLAAGGAAIASAALLGSRNAIYAVKMSPTIGPGVFKRAAAAQLTIDESTAVSIGQTNPRSARIGFWVTGIAVFIGWNLTTLLGALIGDLMGDVTKFGLDAAAAAAFLGLLWPRLKEGQAQAVAVAAGFVAALTTPVLLPGLPIVVAAGVAVVFGVFNILGKKDGGLTEAGEGPAT